MLVLSRKAGERIHIGDDVFVEVRRVAGNRVTLAVSAPRSVRVLRGELLEAAREFEEPKESADKASETGTYIVTTEIGSRSESIPESHTIS